MCCGAKEHYIVDDDDDNNSKSVHAAVNDVRLYRSFRSPGFLPRIKLMPYRLCIGYEKLLLTVYMIT